MAMNLARSSSGTVVFGQVEEAGAEVEARLLAIGEPLVSEGLHLLKGRRRDAFEGSGGGVIREGSEAMESPPSYLAPLRFAECPHAVVTQ